MLNRRLWSAAVIVSFMVLMLWMDHYLGRPETFGLPGLVLGVITTLASIMATSELVRMWRAAGCDLSYAVSVIGNLLLGAGACLPLYWPMPLGKCPFGLFGGTALGLSAALVVAITYEMWQFDLPGSKVERIARQVFSFAYLAMVLGMLAPHRRMFELDEPLRNGSGLCAVLAVIATVKMSDTFAYAFGKLWGRAKLAPKLSPNKTIEGAGGAILGGIVGAAIIFYCVAPFVAGKVFAKPFWWIVVYGVVVTLAGMLGDLAESLIKRDANCKDSSGWLPGLGGVLDIIDSLIFAAPASFLIWILLT